MYKISVKTNFSAAHKLIGYQGNCEKLHGHNWSVIAQVGAKELDTAGIGYDFRKLRQDLNEIIKQFDHQLLNDIPPFNTLNPSSENIARFIFNLLKEKLPPNVHVLSVEIGESENCAATYSED